MIIVWLLHVEIIRLLLVEKVQFGGATVQLAESEGLSLCKVRDRGELVEKLKDLS